MKKSGLILLSVVLVPLFIGCATKSYVQQQIDPLADKIGTIESRI